MKSLIQPAEARRLIIDNIPMSKAVRCPLNESTGRILREPIVADRPLPPFNRSMMDGYAIRASEIDEAGIFRIVAQVAAGSPSVTIGDSQKICAEIMTGAVVPSDADCVIPYEETTRIDDHRMRLNNPNSHQSGDCIHPKGSDHPSGEVLVDSGVTIGARETAVAASCGYAELSVSVRKTIGIVSTGDELVEIHETPLDHQIRKSNDRTIASALQAAGFTANGFAHLPDSPEDSLRILKQQVSQHEVLIMSGGISMGKKDYIPSVLEEMGFICHFHGVAQKPGKPMAFWTGPECTIFTLPGNPISTLTCLHHYVIPSLRIAEGNTANSATRTVELNEATRARDDLTIFLPVQLGSNNRATPRPISNSGDLARILQSDGYIELPPNNEKSYPAGKSFDFHPWH